MTKILITISVLTFFGSQFANAEKVYYCLSELNAGIIKDSKTSSWRRGNFEEQRFTIKFNDDYTILNGLSEEISWNCSKTILSIFSP